METGPTGPVEVRGVDLREAVPGAVLEVLADGPLSWTALSDLDGSLLLDLENAVMVADLGDLEMDSALVESIEVEEVEARVPTLRLTVRTRERIDFAPNILGATFQMRLLPRGRQDQGELVLEPLVIDEFGKGVGDSEIFAEAATEEPASAGAEPEGEGSEAEIAMARATPTLESGRQGPEARGEQAEQKAPSFLPPAVAATETGVGPAGILLGLEKVSPGEILLQTDGSVLFQSFWLENPKRFVIDLPGIHVDEGLKTAAAIELRGARLRVGQFRDDPDPVARIVLDLEGDVDPRIETFDRGLRVLLRGPGETRP